MFLHTTFRVVALAGLILTLWEWRRSKDGRLFFVTLCAGWLIFLSYVAGLVPGLQATEPYRFIAPTMMLAAALAGSWFSGLPEALQLRRQSTALKALLLVMLLLLLPRPLREMLYFIPELMPPVYLGATSPGGENKPPPPAAGAPDDQGGPFRLTGVSRDFIQVAAYLKSHCKHEGRVLVVDWPLGEYLRWATDRPIIGGFPERRTTHQAANIFRRPADPRLKGRALPDYLVRYNIRYVIMTGPLKKQLEERRRLLTLQQIVGTARVYRVNHLATYLARGSGTVTADLNRIEVTNARPAKGTQKVLLRFHHMKGLVCRPSCTLSGTPLPHSPVSFITVSGRPRLPERFVVELRY